jgi:predicted permease
MAGDAIARLWNTLLVTFFAILLGRFCVRQGFITPEAGDTKALGFLVGKIAFPLLFFHTVVTAQLGGVDLGIIAACTLGKVIVMVITWLLAFYTHGTHREVGQRMLTSTVFALFVVASNDFAVGFPVIDALYGSTVDMQVYIAGNALVTSFLFIPLSVVFFSIGVSFLEGGRDEDKNRGIKSSRLDRGAHRDCPCACGRCGS